MWSGWPLRLGGRRTFRFLLPLRPERTQPVDRAIAPESTTATNFADYHRPASTLVR
jgi:hypothetical protein